MSVDVAACHLALFNVSHATKPGQLAVAITMEGVRTDGGDRLLTDGLSGIGLSAGDVEHACENLRSLSPGDDMLLVDDINRDALHTHHLRTLIATDDIGAMGIACEEAVDLVWHHAGSFAQAADLVDIADIGTVFEKRLEQRPDHRLAEASILRLKDQPLGRNRVGRSSDFVEGEVHAFLPPGLFDPLVDLARLGIATELRPEIGAPVHAVFGQLRVQHIGPPAKPDLESRSQGARFVQAHQAKIAPGTGEVGDHIDRYCFLFVDLNIHRRAPEMMRARLAGYIVLFVLTSIARPCSKGPDPVLTVDPIAIDGIRVELDAETGTFGHGDVTIDRLERGCQKLVAQRVLADVIFE